MELLRRSDRLSALAAADVTEGYRSRYRASGDPNSAEWQIAAEQIRGIPGVEEL